MSDLTVGRVYSSNSTLPPAGIMEVLLAKAERDRDRYKQGLEEISTTIQDWLDSIVQEPALDFIHAIKAWADKKLNE